jgi:hypothetical protein
LKGVTVYVDGSREGQILNQLSRDEAEKYIKEEKTVDKQEVQQCATGTCEL